MFLESHYPQWCLNYKKGMSSENQGSYMQPSMQFCINQSH